MCVNGRSEIATCLERAYPSLPISDTQILLFFPPQDSAGFKEFAETVFCPDYCIANASVDGVVLIRGMCCSLRRLRRQISLLQRMTVFLKFRLR
jgi:hypothetical protein